MSGIWSYWQQTMKTNWQIDKNASDWECDGKGDQRFHLRYFRSLPMEKKILAVEEMCALAEAFRDERKKTTNDKSTRRAYPS